MRISKQIIVFNLGNRVKIRTVLIIIVYLIFISNFMVTKSKSENGYYVNEIDNEFYSINYQTLWTRSFNIENRAPHCADLNGDGILDIIGSNYYELFCIDGVTGNTIWEFLPGRGISNNPIIADINGDNHLEIVSCANENYIYCLDNEGAIKWDYRILPSTTPETGFSSPCTGDLNGDGLFEIVVGLFDKVICLNCIGELLWSVPTGRCYCTPSLIDINGDNFLETVISSEDGNLYCINATGNISWQIVINDLPITIPSPVIVNIDGVGREEIILATGHKLHCYNYDGSVKWATTTAYELDGTPSVANIDLIDGYEIIVETLSDGVICFDSEGDFKWQYQCWSNAEPKSISIVDIDNNGFLETIFTGFDIEIIDYLGNELDQHLLATQSFSAPLISDLNFDGKAEIIYGEYNNKICCLSIEDMIMGKNVWPCFKGSNYQNGHMDSDSDLLDDLTEKFYGTNSTNCDTDSDGFIDGWEVMVGLNPLVNDAMNDLDNDKLPNYYEAKVYHTSVFNWDTDHDGFTDSEELSSGSDPLDPLDFPSGEEKKTYLLSNDWLMISSVALVNLIIYSNKKKKRK